ncbi:MAG: hypothetical protein PHO92_05580 [Candidatus Peribacteraceae bacterium]|nr:hypothetical protein [Candidatus Peribacteraceae bacterium]
MSTSMAHIAPLSFDQLRFALLAEFHDLIVIWSKRGSTVATGQD